MRWLDPEGQGKNMIGLGEIVKRPKSADDRRRERERAREGK